MLSLVVATLSFAGPATLLAPPSTACARTAHPSMGWLEALNAPKEKFLGNAANANKGRAVETMRPNAALDSAKKLENFFGKRATDPSYLEYDSRRVKGTPKKNVRTFPSALMPKKK